MKELVPPGAFAAAPPSVRPWVEAQIEPPRPSKVQKVGQIEDLERVNVGKYRVTTESGTTYVFDFETKTFVRKSAGPEFDVWMSTPDFVASLAEGETFLAVWCVHGYRMNVYLTEHRTITSTPVVEIEAI